MGVGEDPDPEDLASEEDGPFSVPKVLSMYPPLSTAHMEVLVAETVYAITAIGGHENPPSRHIVGQEGVASVKEKLKTVSEELEDFLPASYAIDFAADGPREDHVPTGMGMGMGMGMSDVGGGNDHVNI